MLPAGCLRGKECGLGITNESILEIVFDMESDDLKKNEITKSHELNEKINSFRCPESWYKSGIFEMKNTNSKSSSNSSSNSSSQTRTKRHTNGSHSRTIKRRQTF